MNKNYDPVLHISEDKRIWWRLDDAIKLGAGYIPVGWDDNDDPLLEPPQKQAGEVDQDLVMTAFHLAQTDGSAPAVTVRADGKFVEAREFLQWVRQSVVQRLESAKYLDELEHHILVALLRWGGGKGQTPVSVEPPYEPVSAVLSDWFETRFAELPKRHQRRVASLCFPGRWDELSSDQRRRRAVSWDYNHDPQTQADRERVEQLMIQSLFLSNEINALERLPPQTVAEIVVKDEKLKDLRERLRRLDEEEKPLRLAQEQYDPGRTPPPPVEILRTNRVETSTKQDDLAIELYDVLEKMHAGDERVTAATVMARLQARAGTKGSCIHECIREGVIWIRSSNGQHEKLTVKNLNDRLARQRDREAHKTRRILAEHALSVRNTRQAR
ncbi:MAG: hypothetical protein ROZ37_06265 [Aromatoleum sp.]|uniref:hypothetical protein n=1 Tax=Aromatoleum sp. TaxID=2307007 RepID=UPI002893FF95|nr:hypothetical protein [Aromatoleum sp.]MDT3669918.1 hypothetical protein [Aromatoleum sp.]